MPYWTGEKEPDDSYESRKVAFFQQLLKREAKEEFITEYSPIKLKKNLANLNHLLIEVTDGCNLACKYCGYGELYGNYDKRENKNNTFQNVKLLVDYLQELWHSTENLSFNKVCYIGFYGGEPLINFPLIKETIDYLESLPSHNGMRFEYNMTTNAVLLHKYMDYIVEKRFHLLISLDGNEYNDSYRVAKNGKGSFQKVIANVCSLKEKYPDYFEQQVNFNAVLHNRNSVKDIINYIREHFGKVPSIAPLSSNGIRKDKMQEFMMGGAFLVNVQSYKTFGWENEYFTGWGPEDLERYHRMEILGEKPERISGSLYHLHHTRGVKSGDFDEKLALETKLFPLKVMALVVTFNGEQLIKECLDATGEYWSTYTESTGVPCWKYWSTMLEVLEYLYRKYWSTMLEVLEYSQWMFVES